MDRTGRTFRQEFFIALNLGLSLGLLFGVLKAYFFYDSITYFSRGLKETSLFKETSLAENINVAFYVVCFYLLFGAITGIILRALYLFGLSRSRGRGRWFTLLFASSFLCLYSFLKIFIHVNCFKFLHYWGQKVTLGGFVVRKALLSPVVIITDAAIVLISSFIGWLLFRALSAIDASRKIPNRADRDALIFSIGLGFFAYFSLLAPVNNRLPHLATTESIIGNIQLLLACLIISAAALCAGMRLLRAHRRRGKPFLQSLSKTLPATVSCALLAIGLCGVIRCVRYEGAPYTNYLIYSKSPRELVYFLFYLNRALDFDGDGYSWVSPLKDARPFSASLHPMAADIPFNGIDEDGVGGDMKDGDLDGYDAAPHGDDCDDSNPTVHPGAAEMVDGRDNNCDGIIDNPQPSLKHLGSYLFDPGTIELVRNLADRKDLNIIVVVLDALTAEHMSCYGYSRNTTPHIDAFARESVLFINALCNSTGTEGSIPSLILSQHPSTHRLQTAEFWSKKKPPVPLEKAFTDLEKEEFTLIYLSSARILEPLRAALSPEFRCDDSIRGRSKARGEKLNAAAFSLIDSREELPNLFLVLHYFDTHWRYTTPRSYRDHFGNLDGEDISFRPRREDMERNLRYMTARYDGAILYADHLFHELVEHLRAIGQYENSIIVLTADHGTQLMQHNGLFHNGPSYREVQHVPLIMRIPGGRYGGLAIPETVQLMDLMPTLFGLLGMDVPRAMEGENLLPLIASEGAGLAYPFHRFIYSESPNYYLTSDSSFFSIQDNREGYKYLFNFFTGEEELYDISRDPFEREEIREKEPAVRERMKKALFNFKSSQEKKFMERREGKTSWIPLRSGDAEEISGAPVIQKQVSA